MSYVHKSVYQHESRSRVATPDGVHYIDVGSPWEQPRELPEMMIDDIHRIADIIDPWPSVKVGPLISPSQNESHILRISFEATTPLPRISARSVNELLHLVIDKHSIRSLTVIFNNAYIRPSLRDTDVPVTCKFQYRLPEHIPEVVNWCTKHVVPHLLSIQIHVYTTETTLRTHEASIQPWLTYLENSSAIVFSVILYRDDSDVIRTVSNASIHKALSQVLNSQKSITSNIKKRKR